MKARTIKSGGVNVLPRPVLGFSDLARLCRERLQGTLPAGSGTGSVQSGGGEWDGGLDLAKACTALEQGWDAGNLAVLSGLEMIDLDMSDSGGRSMDVAGDFCSVPDYLAGSPECMSRKDAGESPVRMRIVTFCYMHCGVPASAAIDFARANAAFIAMMMGRGFDVAVTVVGAVTSGQSNVMVIKPVTVKDYGQEPDASRIAFSCHPAFLRRAMFCAMEMDTDVPSDCRRNGYGHYPYRADEGAMRACLPDTDGERMVLLPDIGSLDYRGGHEAMLRQILALVADQVDSRGEDRL